MAVGTHALTSLANLKAWLGISSSTYDSVLESAIDRATSIIETYTGRKLKARDIYEWHNGDGSKTVHLDQYPIERMYRVGYGHQTAFTIESSVSTDLELTFMVDSEEAHLRRIEQGGTLAENTFDLTSSSYNNTSKLVSAITALTGFTATLTTNVPSRNLHRIGGIDLIREGPAHITYVSEADGEYRLDHQRGIVYMRHSRGNRNFDHESSGRFPRVRQSILVHYKAGYSTVPDDLERACIEIAAEMYQTRQQDRSVSSETLGDYTYSKKQQAALVEERKHLLEGYRDIR
jgi:hypothetical protein|tara:strand:- start:1038 stop:1907 length:870 start_codon:yes stop_codon:yes gene_type:complete